MQKMGYVFGTGLGPRSQGRVEPVPVVVCPAGKSLDWIADHRDECEAQASSSLQLRKEKKKSSKRKDSSNMFDLLNVACSSRSSSLTTSKSSSASEPKPSSSTASPLNVQSVNQDLAIAIVLLYKYFKILPSTYVHCAMYMSYLTQDGTMKKEKHQNM